ncbi:hypothetical protein FACS1894132_13240 [Clostridia bacterium]|nr:hypothetical protein FACS1894132_13240 [Clostridia bacterium]
MDIFNQLDESKIELVNSKNLTTPRYDLSNRKTYLEIYLCYNQNICIVGRFDPNYIYSCSFSTISDVDRIRKIMINLSKNQITEVTNLRQVLENNIFKLDKCYKFDFLRISEVYCPLRSYFNIDRIYEDDYFFKKINIYFNSLLEHSVLRLADEKYVKVLEYYLELLSCIDKNDMQYADYYEKMKPLINIISEEKYLKLSQNSNIRELYWKIEETISSLYGAYMDKYR